MNQRINLITNLLTMNDTYSVQELIDILQSYASNYDLSMLQTNIRDLTLVTPPTCKSRVECVSLFNEQTRDQYESELKQLAEERDDAREMVNNIKHSSPVFRKPLVWYVINDSKSVADTLLGRLFAYSSTNEYELRHDDDYTIFVGIGDKAEAERAFFSYIEREHYNTYEDLENTF